MNMNMHPRLTGSTTNVYPNVVTIWRMLRLYELACMAEQFDHGRLLGRSHFKEIGNVPARHDNDMTAT